MKPATFEYHEPETVEEALHLLAEHGDEGKVLAGGQSLVPLLAIRLARPAQLVDVNGIDGLDTIAEVDGEVRIGALVRDRAAERSATIARGVPLMAEALPFIGHAAIRNRGTICGSLAHADTSAELPAVAVATDAVLVARSSRAERTIAAADFFTGHFTTALADDELLVEARFRSTPAGAGWGFQELARRPGDFAIVGAAAMVSLDGGGSVTDARLSVLGVADRPVRPAEVEQRLVGQMASADTFAAAAAAATDRLDPASDVHASAAVRRHLAGVVVRRALGTAADRATKGPG